MDSVGRETRISRQWWRWILRTMFLCVFSCCCSDFSHFPPLNSLLVKEGKVGHYSCHRAMNYRTRTAVNLSQFVRPPNFFQNPFLQSPVDMPCSIRLRFFAKSSSKRTVIWSQFTQRTSVELSLLRNRQIAHLLGRAAVTWHLADTPRPSRKGPIRNFNLVPRAFETFRSLTGFEKFAPLRGGPRRASSLGYLWSDWCVCLQNKTKLFFFLCRCILFRHQIVLFRNEVYLTVDRRILRVEKPEKLMCSSPDLNQTVVFWEILWKVLGINDVCVSGRKKRINSWNRPLIK